MKAFMDDNFLLGNDIAVRLYHDHAKKMPIYDYHCHLSAKEIAEDKKYRNITELWLGGDHYKWRALRSNGVDEALITGDAGDKEKFLAWAETIPYTLGNPLYHWTHLELQRYFGIRKTLSPATADEIWNTCNEKLKEEAFSAKSLIRRSDVKVICTTDDPVDDLRHHAVIAQDRDFGTKVLPTFRPDKSFNIDQPTFEPWLESLEACVGFPIDSVSALLKALELRIDHFHAHGCRISDHALDVVQYLTADEAAAQTVFEKKREGGPLSPQDVATFKGCLLHFLGTAYAKRGWAMQIHIGALRNNNRRMHEKLGPDTGFDSIHDENVAAPLSRFLGDLDAQDALPKTILYVLNPKDNYV
ncbi:glucuronate isomerase, partial [Anaerotalea alkaliphila]